MYVAEEGGYCNFLTRQAGPDPSTHTHTPPSHPRGWPCCHHR